MPDPSECTPAAEDPRSSLQTLLTKGLRRRQLLRDVSSGLWPQSSTAVRQLPSRWFYDERGSALFGQITRLPEYYPARTELSILRSNTARLTNLEVETLVELGSGMSPKSALLLGAMLAGGSLRSYVPFDVDESVLRRLIEVLAPLHADLTIRAVVGDFQAHVRHIEPTGRTLVAFLGGTYGNLRREERIELLQRVATRLENGDLLLLGVDRPKDPRRLIAAYDDSIGVTAKFNQNMLSVLNRELGADFDVEAYEHEVRWVPEASRIELWLVPSRRQRVLVPALGRSLTLEAGEGIRTEICAKLAPDALDGELAEGDFVTQERLADSAEDYSVTIARRIRRA